MGGKRGNARLRLGKPGSKSVLNIELLLNGYHQITVFLEGRIPLSSSQYHSVRTENSQRAPASYRLVIFPSSRCKNAASGIAEFLAVTNKIPDKLEFFRAELYLNLYAAKGHPGNWFQTTPPLEIVDSLIS